MHPPEVQNLVVHFEDVCLQDFLVIRTLAEWLLSGNFDIINNDRLSC